MRLSKIVLLALTATLMTAGMAAADIIRTDTTYDGSPLDMSDTLAIDVYLDCECVGGGADASGYLIVQMVVPYDESILTYEDGLSLPAGGGLPAPDTEPGIVIFGAEDGNRNLLITQGAYGDAYYSATGGPHMPLQEGGAVLLFYSAKGLTTGAGSRAGGEAFLGQLVFSVAATGSNTSLGIEQPNGETWMLSLSADRGNAFLADTDITISAPTAVSTVPEPGIAGSSVAVMLTLYGLYARRRN